MDFTSLVTPTFLLGFVGMAAGTFYFLLERNNLSQEHRSTATIAAVITFIAAINYYFMIDFLGEGGLFPAADVSTLRYVDWLLTTPLLLVKVLLLLKLRENKSLLTQLIVADVVMILAGYVGEVAINGGEAFSFTSVGFLGFAVSTLAWLYIVYILFTSVAKAADKASAVVKNAFKTLRYFILIGWAIYPIGYLLALFGQTDLLAARDVVYNIADVVNKVGFGLVTLSAVKALSAGKK
jgi:bacteriorhodopsin